MRTICIGFYRDFLLINFILFDFFYKWIMAETVISAYSEIRKVPMCLSCDNCPKMQPISLCLSKYSLEVPWITYIILVIFGVFLRKIWTLLFMSYYLSTVNSVIFEFPISLQWKWHMLSCFKCYVTIDNFLLCDVSN